MQHSSVQILFQGLCATHDIHEFFGSPAAAEYQVARVARARGLDAGRVRAEVQKATEGRTFGVLGEPRVNVLELNLALDALK